MREDRPGNRQQQQQEQQQLVVSDETAHMEERAELMEQIEVRAALPCSNQLFDIM